MRAVITVLGRDMVGILARVSTECSKANANVTDVTQSIMQDMFAMIMMVEASNLNCKLSEFTDQMKALGDELGLSIHVMHEDVFDSMHKI